MKNFILFTLMICIGTSAMAQITGEAMDNQHGSLPGTTVLLLKLPDSVQVSAQTTDTGGKFRFDQVARGRYLMKATMIGYNTIYGNPFEFSGEGTYTQDLQLREETKLLKEVSISYTVPQLEQKSDRLVVSLEKLNTTGDNALDVLKKAPGIRLDKDDNILFRGNGGVSIMIDGRLTYMSGTELSNYLKTLPANAISKIELMANPPANYDAEGTAGIINIIMKRNRSFGYNGTATATAGYGKYGKLSGGLNLNYNVDKVSFYTRLSEDYNDSYNKLTMDRHIGTDLYQLDNFWHPINNITAYTIGADYFANKKSTFGIMFKGYNLPQNADVSSNSVTTNSSDVQTGSVTGTNAQKININNYGLNLNYNFKIDTTGQKLSLDADYLHKNTSENDFYTNLYFNGSGAAIGQPLYLRSTNPVSYSLRAIKADYIYPFAKTWRAEAGLKSSWVSNDNNAKFDSLKSAGWMTDPLQSNHFLYSENINAAYLTISTSFGKSLDLKASIRTEQTVSTANSLTMQQVIKRNYLQLFPSFFSTYRINEDNQINASFSSRITRPNYARLNPFIKYSDPYTAFEGNPFLQPSLSKSFLLNYTYKNFQVLSLSYIKVNDDVNSVIYQNDQSKQSINRYENLGSTSSLSATSAGTFKISKFWNVSAEIDASYNKVNTLVQNLPYNSSKLSWSANADQTFLFPENFKVLLSAQYYSPSVSGLARTLSGSQIDIGATKTFLNKRATLSFKARDIFFGNRYRSILQYNNVNTTWNNEWESRRFSLGFTYLFGNSNIKAARERKTGTGSEENRM